MNSEQPHPPDWPEDIVVSVAGGVRVFWITAATMQGLTDRLALILSEHMHDGDELHVTYNDAVRLGNHAPKTGSLVRKPEPGWTELRFEYSAFVVLRSRAPAAPLPQ